MDESNTDIKESTSTLPLTSLRCYIHNVSPVKNSTNNDRRYFNFTLQSKDKVRRGVCYNPEKRSEIQTIAATKTAVNIDNVKTPPTTDDDVTVRKFSKITPIDKAEFQFSEELSLDTANTVIPISSISKLAREQLVCVKGEVVQISGIKQVTSQYKGKLRKQDIIIRDPTSSIKITLWEEHVDSLQLETTYKFKNLRVKANGIDRYLNTPQKEPFTATPCESFGQPLLAVDEDLLQSAHTTTTEGKIIGFQRAQKTLACVACKRNVTPKSTGPLAECQSCKLTQAQSACLVRWNVRIALQDASMKVVYLNMPNNILKEVMSVADANINLATATKDCLLTTLLSADKLWKFTCDNRNEIIEFHTN